MIKKSVSMILGAALLTGSALAAGAADLPRGGSIKDGYAPMPMPMGGPSGWYVRGDASWAMYDHPIMVENGVYDLTDAKIGHSWSAGGGIGRYFSPSVRGDFTWDHRFEADASARLITPNAPFQGERRFGLKSDLFLFNAYYDFDTRSRFTPYVGVGLGFVHHTTTVGTVVDTCGCGFTNTTIASDNNWHVAGALMAGFSVALRERVLLDAGYRFLYLGETATGPMTGTLAGGATGQAKDPTVEDIHAHEFRVGLRLNIH